MLSRIYASAVQGVDAQTITIEVHTGGDTVEKNFYTMVGLPDSAVKEGFPRLEAALQNNGYKLPRRRITVNLAPANLRKEGSSYDLPIAIGILASTKQIVVPDMENYQLMGELSLGGELRPIKGALPMAIQARKEGYEYLIVPKENAKEAAIVNKLKVFGVSTLREVIDLLAGSSDIQPYVLDTRDDFEDAQNQYALDFKDVKGQENIKRALELAAAGGHNVILIGPPGAGKTMLAKRLPTILPPLSLHEALETTKIHSVAGLLGPNSGLVAQRPFRSPHHTISDVALVGGGSNPHPGEISLSHHGVLFLDELPEFKRSVLEVMRQPMEERKVTISRARLTVDYPSSFILVASMNPCPCGYYNHPEKECVCGTGVVKRYLNKISGPLLDRIDLHVEVTPVSYEELSDDTEAKEASSDIRERVVQARAVQLERFKDQPNIHANAEMPSNMVRDICKINQAGTTLLKTAMKKLQLSARAYDRILKVSRTAADLAGSEHIKIEHLAEAIQYRSLDREEWLG